MESPSVEYVPYRDGLLPGIVAFWNEVFPDRRNFFVLTEDVFRRRVVEKRTAVESFDPEGLILAVRGGRVRGMIHVGRNPEAVCRVLHPNWPGGEQGYIALKNPATREGELFSNVNWSRTRAYGLGLNSLYLNLRGRERQHSPLAYKMIKDFIDGLNQLIPVKVESPTSNQAGKIFALIAKA